MIHFRLGSFTSLKSEGFSAKLRAPPHFEKVFWLRWARADHTRREPAEDLRCILMGFHLLVERQGNLFIFRAVTQQVLLLLLLQQKILAALMTL